jgi:SpoVK/Ycf46/Vps4 family AAA+-type ATPase
MATEQLKRLHMVPSTETGIRFDRNVLFTYEQQRYIDIGREKSERLKSVVKTSLAIRKRKHEVKRHTYIYSPPGAGKTFTVQQAADEFKVKLVKIQGASSMNGFVMKLVVAAFSFPDQPLIVWVDDCDSLFMDEKGLQVMKGVLDEERNVLSWNVNMTNTTLAYEKSEHRQDQLKAAALRQFTTPGGVGLDIPTDNMRFIITSNKDLCAPAQIYARRGNRKNNMHEAAIRDRVNYENIELTTSEAWGWTAAILLDSSILGLKRDQKVILLRWMWDNYERLPATSMRAVKDLASEMLENPADYRKHWEARLR